MGISTHDDGSIPEQGSTEYGERASGPPGASVTVPLTLTVEFASDPGTTSRTGYANTPLSEGPMEASTIVEDPGSMDPSELESTPRSANVRADGSSESLPRTDPVDRAKIAFANFSLSRFTPDTQPDNFVARDADPKSILDKQRTRFAEEIESLNGVDSESSGMRLSIRSVDRESMRNALPGLGSDNGQIELTDLLKVLRKNLSGTDFRSVGNIALRPLTAGQQLQDRAQTIIDRIKASGAPPKAESDASADGEHTEPNWGEVR